MPDRSCPPTSIVSNPFCAARLRPGTIDFVFEQGKSLQQLVDALEANAWQGQITGGHGTGKSTLLAALTPAIEDRGRLVKSITLAAGQRRLPREFITSLRLSAGLGVAAVDGIEQLRSWNRLLLKRFCRTHGVGPRRGVASFGGLAQSLRNGRRRGPGLEGGRSGFKTAFRRGSRSAISSQRLARHQGNLREALFDLYDLYEERR